MLFSLQTLIPGSGRAGLNERETPGKVVTARPPKCLTQLRSVSRSNVKL